MIVPLPILFGNLLLVLVMHRCCNVTSCVGGGQAILIGIGIGSISFCLIFLYCMFCCSGLYVWAVPNIPEKKIAARNKDGILEPLEEGDSLLL